MLFIRHSLSSRPLRIILSSILICIITFAAYAPSLKNGFVNWDDDKYVRENAVIREISVDTIAQCFSTFFVATYLPVTMLSYMVDYQLVGLDPFGYHWTSLIFHLLNSLLLFWLIFLLSRSSLVALITATLFAVHPLHVESVAWISGRKDVLYGCFSLLSMICYCYYLRTPKRGRVYWLSLSFFVLSLLSKAMAITLPLVLFLLDYFRGRKFDRKMIEDKLPFLILALVFGVLGFYGQAPALRNEPQLGIFGKFLIPFYAVFFYFTKTLIPTGLSCLYAYSGIKDVWIYLQSLMGCLVVLALMLRPAKHSKKIVFGILFFLITLLPVLQFVPMGSTIVADRYMYMASAGLFYLIAEMAAWVYKKTSLKSRLVSFVLIVLFAILTITSLSFLTRDRCKVWKDGIVLFSDALSKHPELTKAYNQRGLLFAERKDYEKAVQDFKSLLRYTPYDMGALINLGNTYHNMGKSTEAIAAFERALKVGTEPDVAYFSLGNVYAKLGDHEKAISFYMKALLLAPGNATASFSLGVLYNKLGKKSDAEQMLVRTLQTEPGFVSAYAPLANLFQDAGRKKELFDLYRHAVARGVPFYDAYHSLGNLAIEQGDVNVAARMFQRAIEIDPADPAGYESLGEVYCRLGKYKKAVVFLKKSLEIDPKLAVAHNNIAVAYYYLHRYDQAVFHCDKAVALGYRTEPKLLDLLKPYKKQGQKPQEARVSHF